MNEVLQVAGYFNTRLNSSTVVVGSAHYVSNVGTGNAIGIYAESKALGNNASATGLDVRAVDPTNVGLIHTGVNANAANGSWQSFAMNGDVKNSNSDQNYGYQTEIYNAKSTALNYGFHGWVNTPGTANYGLLLNVSGATNNYGVYASVPGNAPNDYAGYFNGDVYASGTYISSDIKLKKNITKLDGALDLIKKLNPVIYEYGDFEQSNGLNLPKGEHNGFIAQEIEELIPNAVKIIVHPEQRDSLGNIAKAGLTFKAVNYIELIPIAIMGIKEQGAVIDSLQTVNHELQSQVNNLNDRLSRLENCLNGALPYLCQLSHGLIQENSPQAQELIRQQLSVYLSSKESIVLDQNIPNPFAEQTVINFSIPESVKSAQIHFYDGRGNLIKTIEISQRGLGSITVFGADLSSGAYLYSLVADGIVVASKKMIKE